MLELQYILNYMKLFSVDEANAMIPFLRRSIRKVIKEWKKVQKLAPEVQRAQQHAHVGGGSTLGPIFVRHVIEFQHQVREIESTGVVVKDFDHGLCDFPHQLHGQIVYLCWKLDEDCIQWWHDLESGFPGRQPLD